MFLCEYFFFLKPNGTIFYRHRNPFNFVSNIFFFHYLACGYNSGGNLSALFEMKLNQKIISSWNKKIFDFKIKLSRGLR